VVIATPVEEAVLQDPKLFDTAGGDSPLPSRTLWTSVSSRSFRFVSSQSRHSEVVGGHGQWGRATECPPVVEVLMADEALVDDGCMVGDSDELARSIDGLSHGDYCGGGLDGELLVFPAEE